MLIYQNILTTTPPLSDTANAMLSSNALGNITITELVAIIGCITGCASLFINFYKLIAEKGKLVVRTNNFHNIYFDKLNESKYITKYQCIIYIEVINSTPHPVTIYDLTIRMKDGYYSPDKCPIDTIPLVCKQVGAILTSHFDLSNALSVPYTIEPFGVYKGNIFLGQFPLKASKKEYFYMQLRTTRNTKHLIGKIKKHPKRINQYK